MPDIYAVNSPKKMCVTTPLYYFSGSCVQDVGTPFEKCAQTTSHLKIIPAKHYGIHSDAVASVLEESGNQYKQVWTSSLQA
jgi:hypothetical protein